MLTLDGSSAGAGPQSRGSAPRKPQAGAARSESQVIGIRLLGARTGPTIQGQDELPGYINYLIGNDSRRWHTGIPIYGRVLRRGVWPGVDLAYYGNQRRIEFDLIVAPRANPNAIEMGFVNAGKLGIDARGNLLVDSGGKKLRLLKPIVYQGSGPARREIGGRYVMSGRSRVRFEVAAYDHERPLFIDPVVTLSYSTFLGGSGSFSGDAGNAIAVDSKGNAYVTGTALSSNFPTKNPFQGSLKSVAGGNAFVAKFTADGRSLVYSTYIGGSGKLGESGKGIAVDSKGSAYITGQTDSSDFPTKNPFQSVLKSATGDAFATKLSADGSSLVYSTFLGGSGSKQGADSGQNIAVDSSGNAYVAGVTYSSDFPTKNPFQGSLKSTMGWGNAFVTKFSPDGTSLVYSTYLGGTTSSGSDIGNGIAVDSAGSAYVTGVADSYDFPTKNPFQICNGKIPSGFVSKFSPDGSSVIYSTGICGTGADIPNSIAVDAHGSAYIAGTTYSSDFPLKAPIRAASAPL